MNTPFKSVNVFGLSLCLSACGSGSGSNNQGPILGNWEVNQNDRTHYAIFTPDTLTTLFFSDEFQCHFKLEEGIFYTSNNTIASERGYESEFIIDDNQLIIDPNTDEPVIYSASSVDLNALTYCENPEILGTISIDIKLDDFSELLRPETANSDIDYDYSLDVFLDMDNSNSPSIGDFEFGIYFYSEFSAIKNPTLSQLNRNISIITNVEYDQDDFVTYIRSETVAFPKLTINTADKSISLSLNRGAFPGLFDISTSNDIGVKAYTDYYSSEGNYSDNFPDNGYIDIKNLSSSIDAIGDALGSEEHINLMDITSLSISLSE